MFGFKNGNGWIELLLFACAFRCFPLRSLHGVVFDLQRTNEFHILLHKNWKKKKNTKYICLNVCVFYCFEFELR